MNIPSVFRIASEEFDLAEGIYKIISHDDSVSFATFKLKDRNYYLSWLSCTINVEFKFISEHNLLLIGIDLRQPLCV